MSAFRVGLSRDFLNEFHDNAWGDIGLAQLDRAGVAWRYLESDVDTLRPADIAGLDAVLFARPAVDRSTFDGPGPFPRLFARFGVGYDAVDLEACTANKALVTITPDGARRAVATATLTLILAARHHLVVKDRLVRTANWPERARWMGRGLTGRTVGFIGLGNTGTDLLNLLAPFNCRILASDPGLDDERASTLGATLCDADTVFATADVVVVMAALTPGTRRLVNQRRLALMKSTALFVNVARGAIVDEQALVEALRAGRPGSAALDVFDDEPLDASSPLIGMDNVILTPHSLAWTDEMAIGNGSSAIAAILDVRDGRIPKYVVNRAVLDAYAEAGVAARAG